MSPKRRVWLK
jgi:hypothetical protein